MPVARVSLKAQRARFEAKLKKIESSEGERKSTRMRRLSLPLQSVLLRLCAVGQGGRGPVNVNSQLKVRSKSTSIDA